MDTYIYKRKINYLDYKILFIDDHEINSSKGLKRIIHSGKKRNTPVLKADRPWEAINQMGGTVRKEGSLYRMWYDSWIENTKYNGYASLYAESNNGINWDKPILKKYKDFNGNLNNNIYLNRISLRRKTLSPPKNIEQDHNKNILYTPHLGKDKKYTMIAYDYAYTNFGPYDGYYLAYSKDGITWTDGPLEPVIPGHADVGWFMYDNKDKMFRGIVKAYLNIRGYSRRSVLWTESNDALDWTLPKPAIIPDKIDDLWSNGDPERFTQFYGMPIFRYNSIILGFVEDFRTTDGHRSRDGFTYPQLVSSRDGRKWERVGNRSPVIELGEPGSWDWGSVSIGNSVVIEKEEIKAYYTGRNDTHAHTTIDNEPVEGSIGVATWPIDRFVGLESKEFGTLEINESNPKTSLHINANANNGFIQVALYNNENNIEGFNIEDSIKITSDSLDHIVEWNTNSSLPKIPLKIKIHMQNAEIFSLWWS
jgi:hypothetical protein|tara:strand:- start:913 stop:2346 length:1434 start_codon:yes stop_codon:yes gene_type:complete